MSALLIFTEKTSSRLVYTLDLLIGDLMGLPYELTQQAEVFQQYTGPKFSYASQPLGYELFFASSPFLFETDIKHQTISFVEWEDVLGYFPVYTESAMPFDVFASTFFMVSRYEEYLPNRKDKYDRYRGSQSLNLKAGILEKPMVNYYALALQKLLRQKFPELNFPKKPFRYLPTFDIDIAYSYRGKGWKRTLGGIGRSLLFSRFAELQERLLVLSRGRKDPYDTYDYILNLCDQYQFEAVFFFLLGDGSRFDKNLSPNKPLYRNLIKRIDERCKTGIHLSYRSHIATKVMLREIERLHDITGKEVFRNRYHYLRFQLPDNYQRLVRLGITEDYSMGYAAHVGFRAGICTPFYFFNLKTNEATLLKVFPFAFMDSTFTHYYRSDTDFALAKIQQLMKAVRTCGGDFTALWHNTSLTESGEWKGWRDIFETVARQAVLIQQEE